MFTFPIQVTFPLQSILPNTEVEPLQIIFPFTFNKAVVEL